MFNPRLELLLNILQVRKVPGFQEAEQNIINPIVTCPPRRKRVQSTYTSVSNDCREELVKRVTEKQEKIIEVAKDLKLNYSTAKSILRVYKSQKRVEKIPQKSRIKKKKKRSLKKLFNPHQATNNFDQSESKNAPNNLKPGVAESKLAGENFGIKQEEQVIPKIEHNAFQQQQQELNTNALLNFQNFQHAQYLPSMSLQSYQINPLLTGELAIGKRTLIDPSKEVVAGPGPSLWNGISNQMSHQVPQRSAEMMKIAGASIGTEHPILNWQQIMLENARVAELMNNYPISANSVLPDIYGYRNLLKPNWLNFPGSYQTDNKHS